MCTVLEKRRSKLEKLERMVDVLETKSEQNERRVELERNKRKKQQAMMQEIFIGRQLKNCVPLTDVVVLPDTTAGEVSKPFWVLRSQQENLIATTRPFIFQIIGAAAGAGIVPKSIGKCAKEYHSNHDCATAFYTALLVRVGESPTILREFLELMEEELEEMGPILTQMMKDIG